MRRSRQEPATLALKSASRVALTAAAAGLGFAATNFWIPVGLSAGVVGVVAGGSTTTVILSLSLGTALLWAIYNDYNIKAKGKLVMLDGTEFEGGLILERT